MPCGVEGGVGRHDCCIARVDVECGKKMRCKGSADGGPKDG